MTQERAAAKPDEGEAGLPRLFLWILIVEAITIAGLYWFGRHFGIS